MNKTKLKKGIFLAITILLLIGGILMTVFGTLSNLDKVNNGSIWLTIFGIIFIFGCVFAAVGFNTVRKE